MQVTLGNGAWQTNPTAAEEIGIIEKDVENDATECGLYWEVLQFRATN